MKNLILISAILQKNYDFGPEEYDFSFNNQKFLDTGNHKICEGLLKSYDLDTIKFYSDPMAPNAFFTHENIPPHILKPIMTF